MIDLRFNHLKFNILEAATHRKFVDVLDLDDSFRIEHFVIRRTFRRDAYCSATVVPSGKRVYEVLQDNSDQTYVWFLLPRQRVLMYPERLPQSFYPSTVTMQAVASASIDAACAYDMYNVYTQTMVRQGGLYVLTWSQNPITGQPWSQAEFNKMCFGLASDYVRAYELALYVTGYVVKPFSEALPLEDTLGGSFTLIFGESLPVHDRAQLAMSDVEVPALSFTVTEIQADYSRALVVYADRYGNPVMAEASIDGDFDQVVVQFQWNIREQGQLVADSLVSSAITAQGMADIYPNFNIKRGDLVGLYVPQQKRVLLMEVTATSYDWVPATGAHLSKVMLAKYRR